MNDLELDVTSHDLRIENGDIFLLNSEAKLARQRVAINLLFFREEWFLNLDYGVPYFQTILKKGATKLLVDNIIKQTIRDSYRISDIISFNSIIEDESYIVTLFEATTTDGEVVSITNQVLF